MAGTAVLYTGELLMRRLLPLSALLRLTLVFPDHAPTRFRVALRTGTRASCRAGSSTRRRDGLGEPQEAC